MHHRDWQEYTCTGAGPHGRVSFPGVSSPLTTASSTLGYSRPTQSPAMGSQNEINSGT